MPSPISSYDDKIAREICDAISTTHMMLERLCELNPHWPCGRTIYRWRLQNPEFNAMFVRAKQSQIDPLVSRIFELVRDDNHDIYDTGTSMIVNTARVTRLKIEVDAIKWLSGKLLPKLYGEKQAVEDAAHLIDLPELKNAMTYEQKIQCILDAVTDKRITPKQGNELSNIVEKMCRTFETSEAKPLIEELKKKTKEKSKLEYSIEEANEEIAKDTKSDEKKSQAMAMHIKKSATKKILIETLKKKTKKAKKIK